MRTLYSDVAPLRTKCFEGGIRMNTVFKSRYGEMPVVKTRYGEVRGSVADGVYTFRGIPYAAPPFGANRLRPPQPVEPWTGIAERSTMGQSLRNSSPVALPLRASSPRGVRCPARTV